MKPPARMISTWLWLPGQRDGHLRHARIARASGGVDLDHQRDLARERDRGERIGVRVELLVGAWRGRGGFPALTGGDQSYRLGGAFDRGFTDLVRVREAGGLARDAAQAEALRGIEAGVLQTAIVEREGFGHAVLEIEFAIVAAGERLIDERLGAGRIEAGLGVKMIGHGRHIVLVGGGCDGCGAIRARVRRATFEDKAAVAVAAVRIAPGPDREPHARMAERAANAFAADVDARGVEYLRGWDGFHRCGVAVPSAVANVPPNLFDGNRRPGPEPRPTFLDPIGRHGDR